MRQSGFEPKAVLHIICTHSEYLQSLPPEPLEPARDKIISFIVNSPLIFNHDKVKLIIEIKIETDIERPKE